MLMYWCYTAIVVCFVAAALLRALLKQFIKDEVVMVHIDEFLGNAVSAVFMMELGIMEKHYGLESMYYMTNFVIHLILKHLFFIKVNAYGSPLTFIHMYYANQKKRNFSMMLVISVFLMQVAGLLSGQWISKMLWAYEDHVHVHSIQEGCVTTLSSSYTWYHAFLLEGFGVFTLTSLDFVTPDKLKPIMQSFAILFLMQILGYASGLWMHPVIASAFTFRCQGHHSDFEHVLVYWLGPVFGFILSWEMKNMLQSYQVSAEKKIK